MYRQNNSKSWNVPSGRYNATHESASCRDAGEDSEFIRLIFKLRDNTGAETESRAGINFRTSYPAYFARAMASWLGLDQLGKLFPDGAVTEDNLQQLIGRDAVLDIANEDHGQENPLVVIRQIFPDDPVHLNAGAGRTGRVIFRLPMTDRMHLSQ